LGVRPDHGAVGIEHRMVRLGAEDAHKVLVVAACLAGCATAWVRPDAESVDLLLRPGSTWFMRRAVSGMIAPDDTGTVVVADAAAIPAPIKFPVGLDLARGCTEVRR
jgi:hypothetical protein